MVFIRQPSLIVNCGYARVSIHKNSNPDRTGRNARKNIDVSNRANHFRSQFDGCPSYGIPDGYFEPTGKNNFSQFDRDCNKILDGFLQKFREIGHTRESYLQMFSFVKWSQLPDSEKAKHTLSNCLRCFELHKTYQLSFPMKPTYHPDPDPKPAITLNQEAFQKEGVKTFTRSVLTELNRVFESEASTSFTDALLQDKSLGLERKKTRAEKRREKRNMQKEITKKINKSFAEKAAITMLVENESKKKFHRKRLAQSYQTPEGQPEPKRPKKHSPNFENVQWDKEGLEHTLQNWPRDTTINWSAVARDHGVTGGNAGQVVKEYAKEAHVDTSHISTPNRKPTRRPCMKKLPGFNVPIPSNPSISSIEAEIQSMIEPGRFTLGEECTPYKITNYVMVNGKMTPQDTFIKARKVPLSQIRQKLLLKHTKYMRLTPTATVSAMTVTELKERLHGLHYLDLDVMSHDQLCQLLLTSERSRALCMLHDHATILKWGFIMITVHVIYDPLVFYTDREYLNQHPEATINIQAEVEQPEVYLLSLGSSSAEDQAALVGDRINCLLGLSAPVTTETGIEVSDTLRFFTADHPAAQFEQGTKQGGNYKCGACGCKETLFSDQAHSLIHSWRSLKELQAVATGGTLGRHDGKLQPFENLRVRELKRELEERGVEIKGMLKDDLQMALNGILGGVARVPTLLLLNPTQSLSDLNLSRYEIVASEPLHDLKGHITNLITEIVYVLPLGNTSTQCTHLIENCLAKEKKSAADMRRVVIQIYLLL